MNPASSLLLVLPFLLGGREGERVMVAAVVDYV